MALSSSGLTRDGFERLLARLHPEREQAGETYERLRARLLKFFECRGCAAAEQAADETVNRVARRLEGGEVIRAEDASPYFLGVARNVLREAWDRDRRRWSLQDPARPTRPSAPAPASDTPALECLLRCLQGMPAPTRELVLLYYEEDGSGQIEHRRRIADRLGLAPNALRIRLHRLRARLEQCVNACLEQKPETSRSWDPQRNGRPKA